MNVSMEINNYFQESMNMEKLHPNKMYMIMKGKDRVSSANLK